MHSLARGLRNYAFDHPNHPSAGNRRPTAAASSAERPNASANDQRECASPVRQSEWLTAREFGGAAVARHTQMWCRAGSYVPKTKTPNRISLEAGICRAHIRALILSLSSTQVRFRSPFARLHLSICAFKYACGCTSTQTVCVSLCRRQSCEHHKPEICARALFGNHSTIQCCSGWAAIKHYRQQEIVWSEKNGRKNPRYRTRNKQKGGNIPSCRIKSKLLLCPLGTSVRFLRKSNNTIARMGIYMPFVSHSFFCFCIDWPFCGGN